MPSKTVSVQLSDETLRQVDELCTHYRWKRSQAITEYVNFYHRFMAYMSQYHLGLSETGAGSFVFVRDDNDPDWIGILEDRNAENALVGLVEQLNNGMLASFQPPMVHHEEDDES